MNKPNHADLREYYEEARSWASDRERQKRFSLRLSWTVAGIASCIAIAEAIAIAALSPLKTTVPYTLLVDRQTGHVEALDPLNPRMIAPDKALTRSLLAQYVVAREGFAIDSLQYDYRKVALWSSSEARQTYLNEVQSSNPSSPLVAYPRGTLVQVEIRGISSLSRNTALLRFDKIRTDPGGRRQVGEPWSAVITYRFSQAEMRMADRLINPLGLQVVRYRSNAEISASASPQVQPNDLPPNLSAADNQP